MNVPTWQRWVMGLLIGSIGSGIAFEAGGTVWSLGLGMVVGFILGYFGQNPRELWPALKQECVKVGGWAVTPEGMQLIGGLFWWTVVTCVITSDLYLFIYLYADGVPAVLTSSETFLSDLPTRLFIGFVLSIVLLFCWSIMTFGNEDATALFKFLSSVLFVPTLVLWRLPQALWVVSQIVVIIGYHFMKLIHSTDRVLFGSYMALGVWIGYFSGSAWIGILAGVALAEFFGRLVMRPFLRWAKPYLEPEDEVGLRLLT